MARDESWLSVAVVKIVRNTESLSADDIIASNNSENSGRFSREHGADIQSE